MIEGSQTRFVEGKPPQTFHVGDVTQENPGEISESDILTPTKVLLFRDPAEGTTGDDTGAVEVTASRFNRRQPAATGPIA